MADGIAQGKRDDLIGGGLMRSTGGWRELSLARCAGDKQPHHVRARSLLCYWAVRELGMTATALAKILGLSQPAVTQCVRRGEKVATDNDGIYRHCWGVTYDQMGVTM